MWLRLFTTWPSCTSTQGKYADAEALYKRALAIQREGARQRPPRCGLTPSTTWPSCTRTKASTPRPRGSTSARWRSRRRRSAKTTPMWPHPQQPGQRVSGARQVRRRRGALQARAGDREKALGADHPDVAETPRQPGHRVQGTRQVRRRRGALQARAGDQGEGARRRPPRLWPRPSTTWPSCTRSKASTPTPRGSTSARWRSSEKALGADHPDVAATLNNLADVYASQGKYADAEGL